MTLAVIGLGSFGCRIAQELEQSDVEMIIVDKDRDIVEKFKNTTRYAYITDALNDASLNKILPDDLYAAVVDLGSQLESSILVTNHLHKMGVKHIVVKARSDDHGEILKLVGATDVVYPDLDAAQRITPVLISSGLFNYLQLSEKFALAEVGVRDDIAGKTLAECGLRQKYHLNLVAIRESQTHELEFANSPTLVLDEGMSLLVAGTYENLKKYTSYKANREKVEQRSKMFKYFNFTSLIKKH